MGWCRVLLHVGGDRSVYMRSVVAILSLEGREKDPLEGLAAQRRIDVARQCALPAKSGVVECRRGVVTLYLSPISSATLILRMRRGGAFAAERNRV